MKLKKNNVETIFGAIRERRMKAFLKRVNRALIIKSFLECRKIQFIIYLPGSFVIITRVYEMSTIFLQILIIFIEAKNFGVYKIFKR